MLLYVDAQYASPYAMSVFVGLREKDLPVELRTLDLGGGAQSAPDYAAQSLTQRVPLLVDGEFRLSESSAITEYLDEAYSGAGVPLYPAELKARARARQVQAWLRSDLMPIRVERSTEVVFYRSPAAPLSDAARAAAAKLFGAAEALLDGREHLCGQWCIADVDLALMLNRLVLGGDEVPPRLREYAARQWQRASVQEWAGMKRPLL